MKFSRLFTILLSVLTVLLVCQDKALAQPADQIVELSNTESEESALPNTGKATLDEDKPKPKPDPEPEPEPDDPTPFPDPLPRPPYSS